MMSQKNKGRFVGVACAMGLWATAGSAVAATDVPHVLVMGPLDNYGALLEGLFAGLASAGFDNSRVHIDTRSAKSPDEAKAVIGPALDGKLTAIVTIFGPATAAANGATTSVPIVFCPVADPVASKFATSAAAPGGNLTGIATADPEASRRRVAEFRRALPKLKTVALLFDSGFPPDKVQVKNLDEISSAIGIRFVPKPVDNEAAVVSALKELGPADADGIFILKDSLLRTASDELKAAAGASKVPLLVGDDDLVEFPGVVAAVGPNQRALGKACGTMTAEVLKGAKPATIPIGHPDFDLLVNLKTAQTLHLTIPEAALKKAARVVR